MPENEESMENFLVDDASSQRATLTGRGETRFKPWIRNVILGAAVTLALTAIVATAATMSLSCSSSSEASVTVDNVTASSTISSPMTLSTPPITAAVSTPSPAGSASQRWFAFLNPPGMDTALKCGVLHHPFRIEDMHLRPFEEFNRLWVVFKPEDDICIVVQSALSLLNPKVTQDQLDGFNGEPSPKIHLDLLPKLYTELPFKLSLETTVDFNESDLFVTAFTRWCSMKDTIIPVKQCAHPPKGDFFIDP